MKLHKKIQSLNSIAVIGNYLPRRCGIATFTHDLCEALDLEIGDNKEVSVVAMDDKDAGYQYPSRVKFQLRDNLLPEYLRAADFLNVKQYNAVILQHEFGIFGGQDGSHILTLLKNLNMPIITTLHTILDKPSKEQFSIITNIAKYSDAIISMSKKGMRILKEVYKIPESKIFFSHHGIHDIGFEDPYFHKETFGVEERKVILTFGLLHPGKGIEHAIYALQKIAKQVPEVMYIVLGATHPNILRDSGDAYRQSLLQLVKQLDLKKHIQFQNKFVDLKSLCQYMAAADIYITPYLNREQIVSGTLAYALGAGKAIVSTPYWYAEELLDDNRGELVDFSNPDEMADKIIELFKDDKKRNAMRRKAYQFGRSMTWKEVARSYFYVLDKVLDEGVIKEKFTYLKTPKIQIDEYPQPKLTHLKTLTDDVGIIQHAKYSIPDRNHGYCVDDNARAFIVSCLHYSLYKDDTVIPLMNTYLSFIYHAFNTDNNRFRNFMSYERVWLEDIGSEDSHGRVIWSLGVGVKYAPNDSIRHMSARLFVDALQSIHNINAIRSIAFCIIGIHYYLEIYSGDADVRQLRKKLSENLLSRFDNINNDEQWLWPEDILTYANAKIPHALILSGQWIPDSKMFTTGIKILKWLIDIQTTKEGHLSIIGNSNWMRKNGEKSKFDQQPIEVMGIIEACNEAYRSTKDENWLKEAYKGMNWYLGNNDINVPLYNFSTGGCYDGLEANKVNQNQGAESTLACLISLLTIQSIIGQKALLKSNNGLDNKKAD